MLGPIRHADGRLTDEIRRVNLEEPPDPLDTEGRPATLRAHEPTFVSLIDDAALDALFGGRPQTRALFERIHARSAITIPLRSESFLIGVLTCAVDTTSGRQLSGDDAAVLQEVAMRIANAYERARRLVGG